ncbi:lysosome-associated membrane glycoprotein 1-like [Saccoglossus kowalevskii]|uniref:Lysosome-associated membrane glycoprotein 5 n=1 Tax=Saccoglossus kowalevskii TaxID=10224 RepID=A0ABM0GS19_SACKO|nr:PREDICTED: lysosome-associated membrane glycoprotein 2-like [Saccoglossus kowalevskii]
MCHFFADETRLSTVELDATLAPKGDSYKCDSIISAVYSDFTCTTRMLQLQPFGVENGTYSKATICPEDPTPSPAPTPTPKPTQTPTPPPSPGTWNVTDKEGKLCLLAQFGMEFTIPYSTSMAVENATFPLPVTAVVDTVKSTCGLNNSVLVLNFNKDSDKSNNLTMKFEMNATNFYTTQVTLDYFISHADFPNATDTGAQKNVSTSDQLFKASKDKSYSCHAEQVYNLGKGFMETSDVQLQPFNVDEDFSPSMYIKIV